MGRRNNIMSVQNDTETPKPEMLRVMSAAAKSTILSPNLKSKLN